VTNQRLRNCPCCLGELDAAALARMGIRDGAILNSLCPGLNGPSDIDHVLHNMHVSPERFMFLEYKGGDTLELPKGQQILRTHLMGNWQNLDTGRRISIAHQVLPLRPSNPGPLLQDVVDRVWPNKSRKMVL
jgi:hypothetical protein